LLVLSHLVVKQLKVFESGSPTLAISKDILVLAGQSLERIVLDPQDVCGSYAFDDVFSSHLCDIR
jgi:hypothetical protein